MKTNEKALWEKISRFRIDDESAALKFSQRLARENGWSQAYAKEVIEEYKKFLFLCCTTDKQVTPSEQVDQAWHLHLTYTKSYWNDLCKNTLQKEIHHNPTNGGKEEGKKFDDFYTGTLQLYKDMFGNDPPRNIWPPNDERFSDIHFERVNRRKYWIVPKPAYNKRVFLYLAAAGLMMMQACDSGGGTGFLVIGICVIFGLIANTFAGGKKGKGGSGSDGGCGGGCGSDSGGDSGCSSGCSGCGGGCGGCGS